MWGSFPHPILVGGSLCLLQESSWTARGPLGTIGGARLTGAILLPTAPSHNPRRPPRCLQHGGHLKNTWRGNEFIEHLLSARALRENLHTSSHCSYTETPEEAVVNCT